ncbi:hypothetical protein EFA46_016065 (plasmid) [Halarchaeum sp. CBA1220]|uniref:hypothetical protein n=1 Tax=Halarchaeum sp. CBA1220 TaxID=1853682 RepID=UPI0015A1F7F4|nr:hypothetical protein [Halarchaeum sp. CBA1220]QLC35772.1 hypothetical protein EFA46_016065 [Halarchaeum sp. CBA1220]
MSKPHPDRGARDAAVQEATETQTGARAGVDYRIEGDVDAAYRLTYIGAGASPPLYLTVDLGMHKRVSLGLTAEDARDLADSLRVLAQEVERVDAGGDE